MEKLMSTKPAPTPSWHLTDEVLIEVLTDGQKRIWGRWDRQFGCWDCDGNQIFPEGRLLGRLGTWLEPEGPRDEEWYKSRAALAAYWSIIPTPVRLAVWKGDKGQWRALLEEWSRRFDQRGTLCEGGQ